MDRLVATDPAAAEHDIFPVKHRGLARGDRALRGVQPNAGAPIRQRRDCGVGPRMAVANLGRALGWLIPDWGNPVATIDFEPRANEVIGAADDDAIGCRIEIDDVTRRGRAAGQTFAL